MINPDPKMISQLNLLSDLIGSHRSNPGRDSSRSGLVKLSLFDEEDEDDDIDRSRFIRASTIFLFHCCSLFRMQTRPRVVSPPANSRTRNDDITIDVSKVSIVV
jgi:hypothetical protein